MLQKVLQAAWAEANLVLIQQCLIEGLFPLPDFSEPLFVGADLVVEIGDKVDVRIR